MGTENSKSLNLENQRKIYTSSSTSKLTNSPTNSECDKFEIRIKTFVKEMEEKDSKIEELQREIDKLKSVLDQTYNNNPIESANVSNARLKRLGISGESSNLQGKQSLNSFPKSNEVKRIIRQAIMNNLLLGKLDPGQVNEIIECMYEKQVVENCFVINEGEEGQHLFVAQDGEFEVFKDNKLIGEMSSRICFGELALLYNCKRTASIKALKTATLWVLDRNGFQTIMMKTGLERQKDLRKFLESVNLFENLPEQKLLKIVELVEIQSYSQGQCIIREGEEADSFYIIHTGSVKVTQKINDEEVDVREMTAGDFFGEKALLEGGKRTASIYAINEPIEVLCLYRKAFSELIGDLGDLQTVEYDDELRKYSSLHYSSMKSEDHSPEMTEQFSLHELERVNTLGLGGFGRVELVISTKDPSKSYALKCMKKHYIVQTKQQEHVLSEKRILLECRSPFICKLYATFHDKKYIYLLTEVCLGGELWTILRDQNHFDDTITRFCLACVIEALSYLHGKGIIYRDLKPENLLIGNSSYLKLCDFGFAKKIGIGGKTWTFCGTPEYVAPEIILNKGHNFSVDFWSIGILTYELLNGAPPFVADDPMKIYHMTIKGIETSNLYHNFKLSIRAVSFIQSMCNFLPIHRLGNGKNGINEIRKHKYFQGFDWEGMKTMSIPSPFNQKFYGPKDVSNFDKFSFDSNVPPDETSGWDKDF